MWRVAGVLALAACTSESASKNSENDHADSSDEATPDTCAPLWAEAEPEYVADGCSLSWTLAQTNGMHSNTLLEADAAGIVLHRSRSTHGDLQKPTEDHWTRRVDGAGQPHEVWTWENGQDPDSAPLATWGPVTWDGALPATYSSYNHSGDDGVGGCPIYQATNYTCAGNRLTNAVVVAVDGHEYNAYEYRYDSEGRILFASVSATGDVMNETTYAWSDDAVSWCCVEYGPHDDTAAADPECETGCDECGRQTFDGDGRLTSEEYGVGWVENWTYDPEGHPTGFGDVEITTDCDYGELRHGAFLGHGDYYDPATASLREAVTCW